MSLTTYIETLKRGRWNVIGCISLWFAVAFFVGGLIPATGNAAEGPVAWYRLDGNALDSSGNGNDGQVRGVVTNAADRFGRMGGAAAFDGSSFIEIPDSPPLRDATNGVSIVAWVRSERFYNAWLTVACKANWQYGLAIHQTSGWWWWGDGSGSCVSATNKPQLNVWQHLAMTYEGGEFRGYINGVCVATKSGGKAMTPQTGTLLIGADVSPVEYFVGAIDDVRVYDRALLPDEIMALYAEPAGESPEKPEPPFAAGFVRRVRTKDNSFDSGCPIRGAFGATNVLRADELYEANTCPEYTQYAYASRMWLDAHVVYSFRAGFDDRSVIQVDGKDVCRPTSDCKDVTGTHSVAKSGWYELELRGWNRYGAGGAYPGFWYKPEWSDDWIEFADTGDGAKFRVAVGEQILPFVAGDDTNAVVCVHDGPVTNDTLWAANCTHLLLGDLVVASNATLRIGAGAVVKLPYKGRVVVERGGALRTDGGATNPVTFTVASDAVHGAKVGGLLRGIGTDARWLGFDIDPFARAELGHLRLFHCGIGGSSAFDLAACENLEVDLTTVSLDFVNTSSDRRSLTLRVDGEQAGLAVAVAPNVDIVKKGGGTLLVSPAFAAEHGMTVAEGKVCLAEVSPDGLHKGKSGSVYSASTRRNSYLMHRWSFNGTFEDSVGDQTARPMGKTPPGFTEDGKSVHLPGGANGTGYVSLGRDVLRNGTAATIEIWARQNSLRGWSRVFDFGLDRDNYMMLAWSRGAISGSDSFCIRSASSVLVESNDQLGGFAVGQQFHISLSFVPMGDGTTVVAYAKRDATTGEVLRRKRLNLANWTVESLSQDFCYLGRSFFADDSDADADYDEVRIWNAALSDEQLTCNALAGPDSVPDLTGDVDAGVAATADGTLVPMTAGESLVDRSYLTHRWSFNGDYADSVGGQTAEPRGRTAPTFAADGKSVRLPGGGRGTSWIDLCTNALGNAEPVTLEIWATQHGSHNYDRVLSFGKDTSNYLTLLWRTNNAKTGQFSIDQATYDLSDGGSAFDVCYHIAMSIVRENDQTVIVTVSKRDAATGRLLNMRKIRVANDLGLEWNLARLVQAECNLGHSFFDTSTDYDGNASYDEVRVWRAALSEDQLRQNALAGPDFVPDLRPTLPTARRIDVAAGATLDLCGGYIVCSNLTGDGSVVGGRVVSPFASSAPVITTTTLPEATEGDPYAVRLAATGGATPYSWKVVSGEAYERRRQDNSFDASSDGSLVPGTSGDNVCGSYALPFAFPYFGKTYTNAWLSSNGTLSLDGSQTNRSLTEDALRSRVWIVGLWKDLWLSSGGVYVTHASSEKITFRWKGVYYNTSNPINFAITLFGSGKIVLSYGEGNASGGWFGLSSGSGWIDYENVSTSLSGAADVVYLPDGLPFGLALDEVTGTISGTARETSTNLVHLAVVDANGGVARADLTLAVNAHANARPEVEALSPADWTLEALPDADLVFSVRAQDPEGQGLTYIWLVDGETNLVETAGTFTFRPAETFGGVHQVTCLVTDGFWTVPAGQIWTTETPKWYVTNGGSDSNGGHSFADGFATLQKAVNAAADGDIVYVATGTYAPFSTNNKDVRVWAARGARPVVDGGGTSVCVVAGSNGNATSHFRGLTLRNGFTKDSGGGARSGTFEDCIIENCRAGYGGGAYYSTLVRCILRRNRATVSGGGAQSGTLTDCQVEENEAGKEGGGVSAATLTHCTVVRNQASLGGGISSCWIYNSIVWDNRAADGVRVDNFNSGSFYRSCTTPAPSNGSGHVTDDPLLVRTADGLYRLFEGSPCIDVADASYSGGDLDLARSNRVVGAAADLGATEGAVRGRRVFTVAEGAGTVTPSALSEDGASVTLEARALDANRPFLGFFANGEKLSGSTNSNGVWHLVFTPTADETTVTAKFAALAFHVSPDGDDTADGLTWATARRTINAAVALARSGDEVVVTNGVYGPFAATNNLFVTVRSVNGYGETVIDGGGTNRCVLLGRSSSETNTVVVGFTLRNGKADYGAGAEYGTLRRCYVRDNVATRSGGGMYYGTADSCVFFGNTADWGGGVAYGIVYGCTIYGNGISSEGGGCYSCTAYNTIIRRNFSTTEAGQSSANYSGTSVASCCLNDWNTGVSGGYAIDPLFVCEEEGDFRLRSTSPVLGLGANDYVLSDLDLAGDARLADGMVAIGAFESPVTGHVIKTVLSGHGGVTPAYALRQTGEAATFVATVGERPFLGFSTNGIDIVETGTNFVWRDIAADGVLTVMYATNVYVSAETGDDANDGLSPETAKRSLQAAIDMALPGDVVNVADGVYQPVVTGNKRIDVVATKGWEQTVIDGGGTNRCVTAGTSNDHRDSRFVGFTIQNGYYNDHGGGCRNGTYERCLFTGNVADVQKTKYGGAAWYATLVNCLVVSNRAYGGGGVDYCSLTNCTVTGNTGTGDTGGCHFCTVVNSIVWDNFSSYGARTNYYAGTITYSCVGGLTTGTGNICANPVFADAANGDYRLRQYSPCLNRGSNAAVVGDLDLAGSDRILEGTVDMGAFEGCVDLPEPATPTDVTAGYDRHIGFVRLAWTGDSFAGKFRIERADDADFANAVTVGETSASFYDDATVEPLRAYWYRVVAVNLTGESAPSEAAQGRCLEPLSFAFEALPDATAGLVYRTQLEVSGGAGPYVWASGADDYDTLRSPSSYLMDVAEPQGILSGDDVSVACPLPFDFPFYGKTYNKLWVSSNGTLTFDGAFTSYSPSVETLKAHPMIAAFWKDLVQGSGGVYVSEEGAESVTFLWHDCAYHGGGRVNASVTLYADGTVVCAFGEGNASGAFVGVSAGDGKRFRCENLVGTSLVEADDIWFAPQDLPAGLTLAPDGTVEGTATEPGSYTFTVFATDALGNGAMRQVTLEVTENPNLRTVSFDLGEHGSRTGGGALLQYVLLGEDAAAPTLRVESGWVFAGWDRSFAKIEGNVEVRATYRSAFPNLTVSAVSAPESAVSGEEIEVAWTVGNDGNVSFDGSMTETISLVSTADATDVRELARVRYEGRVPRDGTVERRETVKLPLKGVTGDWRVRVETAVAPSVREAGGENACTGEGVLRIAATPLPDLRVKDVGVVGQASLVPGETVTVAYVVANVGAARASGPRTDALSLVSAATGESARLGVVALADDLEAGAERRVEASFAVPELIALAGDVKVRVEVDASDDVAEVDETDNAAESAAAVSLAERLYLEVSPASVAENGSAVRLTARRSGPTTFARYVTLAADVAGQIDLPVSVQLPAGNASTSLTVKPIDNARVDGVRTVRISGVCNGARAETTLTIVDDEKPRLTVTTGSGSVREGGTAVVVTVTREGALEGELVVRLTGSAQLVVPASVTIPAGEASVSFEVTAHDDDVAEIAASAEITVAADGYVSGKTSMTVEDDDVPGVELAFAPEEVTEGSFVYATLTRTDDDSLAKAIKVRLTAEPANQLYLPATVTVPAYTRSARFTVTALDNALDDGDRTVQVTGAVVIESCGCSGQPSSGDAIEADLLVHDNDGAALTLRAEPVTMKEGLETAGWLVLAHNTVSEDDVTVRLSHDGEDEIVVPESVVIPAGETSVRIPVTTLDDRVEDGTKLVSVYADAEGFAPGSAFLQVTDCNQPDFAVTSVTFGSASVVAGEAFEVAFAVTNIGFAARSADVPYAVYLVRGASDATDDACVAVGDLPGPLPIGGVLAGTVRLTAPETPGDWRVIVKVDPDGRISELDEANNEGRSGVLAVTPSYTAVAAAEKAVYAPGETVVLTGCATRVGGGVAGGLPLDVVVRSDASRRTLTALTASDGTFSASFDPEKGEGGTYSVFAGYPGVDSSAVQSTFDVVGLKRTSSGYLTWDVTVGETVERSFGLKNLSGIPLTALTVTAADAPEGCEIAVEAPDRIDGGGQATVKVTATAAAETDGTQYKYFSLVVETAEGVSVKVPAAFYAQCRHALLKATPVTKRVTATAGQTSYVTYSLVNAGAAASGRITLSPPDVAWVRLVGGNEIADLPSGETATVTVELTPPLSLVLNKTYEGGIGVSCENGNSLSLGLAVIPVSDRTGTLRVDVTDTLTLTAAGAPHVAGASVRVTNPATGAVVASGTTGEDGVFTTADIPAGRYYVAVEANRHTSKNVETTVYAGMENSELVYLDYSAVTYTWRVVPTEIVDQYKVELVAEFETHVPVPTMTIKAPASIPALQKGESYVASVQLVNNGLIALRDPALSLNGSIGSYVFEQITPMPEEIPALSSVTVYVRYSNPPEQKKKLLAAEPTRRTVVCTHGLKAIALALCGDKEIFVDAQSDNITLEGTSCSIIETVVGRTSDYVSSGGGSGGGSAPVRFGGGGGGGEGYMGEPIESVVSADCECLVEILDKLIRLLASLRKVPPEVLDPIMNGIQIDVNEKLLESDADLDALIDELAYRIDKSLDFEAMINSKLGVFGDILDLYEKCREAIGSNEVMDKLLEAREEMNKVARWMNDVKSAQNFLNYLRSLRDSYRNGHSGGSAPIPKAKALLAARPLANDQETIEAMRECLRAYLDLRKRMQDRQVETVAELLSGAEEAFQAYIDNKGAHAICTSVKLKLSQTVSMTREAFEGTLTLENGNRNGDLSSVKFEPIVKDEDGNDCTALFGVTDKEHAGFGGTSFLGGDLTLGSAETGSAVLLFVPTVQAAPTVPKTYTFGGRLTYVDTLLGDTVTVDVIPVPLQVNPCPNLTLDYFLQRDVFADDPFTPDVVEPSLPAEFAVLIRNEGYGDARNVVIQSAQPEVIENEKGLAIDFALKDYSLDATALNGATAYLGLNDVSLGTIPAKGTATAQWWLTSTIQGHFRGVAGTVTHLNSWGNPDTSLIGEVRAHKLVRSVVADDDGLPDFLTTEGDYGEPDALYTSLGEVLSVRNDASVDAPSSVKGANPVLTLTVTAQGGGWTGLFAPIEGLSRYMIAEVRRSDGKVLPARNAWITDRLFRDGVKPLNQDRFHLADEIPSAGEIRYIVNLVAKPTDVPAVEAFEGMPADVINEPLSALTVAFNKPIDPETFDVTDLAVMRQGTAVHDLSSLTLAAGDATNTRFVIGNLASLQAEHGMIQLTVQCAGIADLNGTLGSSGKSVSWVYAPPSAPYVVNAEGLPVRPVRELDEVELAFSTAVDPDSLKGTALLLNGNPVGDDVAVRALDDSLTRFAISGLENLQGEDGPYALTVVGGGVKGVDGSVGVGDYEIAWTRDTSVPTLLSLAQQDGLDGVRFVLELSKDVADGTLGREAISLSRDGLPVVLPETLDILAKGRGVYAIVGLDVVLTEDGMYVLNVDVSQAVDEAGNRAKGTASLAWTVDTTPPAPAADLAVSPDSGVSDGDGVTDTRELTLSGTLFEEGLSLSVLCRYPGGSETQLAVLDVAPTSFAVPIVLPGDGAVKLVVRVRDAAGNEADAEKDVFVDALPLAVELDGAPADRQTPASSFALAFGERLMDGDLTPDCFVLTRDGVPVPLTDAVRIEQTGETTYALSGLETVCSQDGTYRLMFDAATVHKSSSGLAGVGTKTLTWVYQRPDREPPVVLEVLVNDAPTTGVCEGLLESVSVFFSEAVNVPELVETGLIGSALRIDFTDGSGQVVESVRPKAEDVVWDEAANLLSWACGISRQPVGKARLYLDAGLICDGAGNALMTETGAVRGGLRTYALQEGELVRVHSFAMPTWHDFDGDGKADLLVGEKTADGKGKVRVYLNVGTSDSPSFGGYAYLQAGDAELTLDADGCQGAQVCFADWNGDGVDDLVVGFADGRVDVCLGSSGGSAFGSSETIRSGGEALYGSPRAVVTARDVDGDGADELVVGGLDGRFRILKRDAVSGGTTTGWLTAENGDILSVPCADGRSAPVFADVNGDGCVDLLSGCADGGVWAFLGDGLHWRATPLLVRSVGLGEANRSRLAVGDVNGDGLEDVLVGRSDGSVSALLAAEGESFAVSLWEADHLDLACAVNLPNQTFEIGGAADWRPLRATETPDGEHGAVIGSVANGTSAWLQTTFAGYGTLSFAWKCFGEGRSDMLQVVVDGVVRGTISGTTEWTTAEVEILGEGDHVVRWLYRKGRSGRGEAVAAWLDGVTWRASDPGEVTLAKALNENLYWMTDGDAEWTPKAAGDVAHPIFAEVDGPENGQSARVWAYVYGEGTLSFDWAGKIEDGFDWLDFSVDGECRESITGLQDWTSVSVKLGAGTHRLEWEFWKDEEDGEESSAYSARLDNVLWLPNKPESVMQTTGMGGADGVSFSWLKAHADYLDSVEGDFAAAARLIGRNGQPLWQSYVAGLEPDDETSEFKSYIEIVNGVPKITWDPDLGALRRYTVYGKHTLIENDWKPVNETNKAEYNFFKVGVELLK